MKKVIVMALAIVLVLTLGVTVTLAAPPQGGWGREGVSVRQAGLFMPKWSYAAGRRRNFRICCPEH